MNCDNMRGCCSPCSALAQQLEETNTRAVQAYNLAARAFASVIPPQGGRNIDVTLVPGPAYEVSLKNPMDEDVVINADLTVNGDIYQNGSAYETHAEQLYTTKDTVIMRDGATTGLGAGDVSGLIMKMYDGVNDGALVVSNDGTARVGDVGSEQPLLTRDESGSMVNGELLQWNGTGEKAVCSGVTTSQIVRGSGNIGSDTKPVKIVGGVATAITNDLVKDTYTSGILTLDASYTTGGSASYVKFGKVVMITISNLQITAAGYNIRVITDAPKPLGDARAAICDGAGGSVALLQIPSNGTEVFINSPSSVGAWYAVITYLCE